MIRPLVPAPRHGTRISDADVESIVEDLAVITISAGREMRQNALDQGLAVGPSLFTDEHIRENLSRALRSELAPLLWEGDQA